MNSVNFVNLLFGFENVMYFSRNLHYIFPAPGEVHRVNEVHKRESRVIQVKSGGKGGFLSAFILFLMNIDEYACTCMRVSLQFAMQGKARA